MSWSGGLIDWVEGTTAYISVVFSWQLQKAYQRAVWLRAQRYHVRAGGPAISINPSALVDVAEIGSHINALQHHNPDATFTTRGCIRNCSFCIVPEIEGGFIELDNWEVKPIICDNNLLAASRKHFNKVIDKLHGIENVDFNQGLDVRLLTDHHAKRFAELDYKCIRIAWDNTKTESLYMRAFDTLRRAGIPASKIFTYVLIGYHDTPEDALYRLETVRSLGAYPNPMRYQPPNAPRRNSYVEEGWTDLELNRYMRYWANLRFTSPIKFSEFLPGGRKPHFEEFRDEHEHEID